MTGLLFAIADSVGAPVAGLRLIITIAAGYPLAFLYRTHIFKLPANQQHLFIFFSGIALMLFNCGLEIWHSLISILMAYLLCKFIPGTRESVIIAWAFFFTHLMVAYWQTESEEYDITYTTPQCILTLRLIGLITDLYDGYKDTSRVRPGEKQSLIKEPPGLLEIGAFTYFFSSCLVGPQYPLARMRRLVNGEFNDPKTGKPRMSVPFALRQLGYGIAYIVAHLILYGMWSNEYLNTDEFYNRSFFWRYIDIMIWFRAIIMRYLAAWLINEGSSIICGLAFNGVDEAGNEKWDGVRDVFISRFEKGCTFQESFIDAFNYNTNQWSGKYVFRRLKFLNNRTVSHLSTLLFLATWHGYHLGYFLIFGYEFLCMIGESQFQYLASKMPKVQEFAMRPSVYPITWLFCKWIVQTSTAFGFLTFGLVKKEKWYPVIMSMCLYGYVFYMVVWPALFHFVLKPAVSKKKKEEKPEEKKEL